MVRVSREMAMFGVALIVGIAGNIVANWMWESFKDARTALIALSLFLVCGLIYLIFWKGADFKDSVR